jgi:hypothetical protein
MNRDIVQSLYRENVELKQSLEHYRIMVAKLVDDPRLPEDLANQIRQQQQQAEIKKN